MFKSYNISYFLCATFIVGVAPSCLHETQLSVAVDFECVNEAEYNTTPLSVKIENRTTGADRFEWTFEGGTPAASSDKNPGRVTFSEPGTHSITLRAWNHDAEDRMEVIVRVDSAVTADFDCEILANDFAPAQTLVSNTTRGAGSFEWTFEGGEPATSTLRNLGAVLFSEAGEHRITLKASNGSETFTVERRITLRPTLEADFTLEPLFSDGDTEAPHTVTVRNTSRSSLSVVWQCEGGVVADPTAEETTVLFNKAGTYTVTLTADNLKEQKSAQKQVAVSPDSGIHTITGLRLGVSQARNTVGCFFSADMKRVLKQNEITSEEIGRRVDLGFFALNSDFDYCYFFSPDEATESAFAEIPSATTTAVNNINVNGITQAIFEGITAASGFDLYSFDAGTGTGHGNFADTFTLDTLPVFVVFRTQDGRRGIVMIREAVRLGAESYAVADIKIEK
jgi:PKD repeat protein